MATEPPKLPVGIWRRAQCDWAYRVEIPGYGSIAGVGFSTRAEAKAARDAALLSAASAGTQGSTDGD